MDNHPLTVDVFDLQVGQFDGWTEPPSNSISLSRDLLRFNLDTAFATSCIMPKTAPLPVLKTFTEPTLHRIAVNVTQFFYELPWVANVEIVVALLPEMLRISNPPLRYFLLQRLSAQRQRSAAGAL